MTRRSCLILPLIAAGCARPRPLEDVLPKSPGPGWTLAGAGALPLEQAPDLARRLGLRRALRAVYRGQAEVEVIIYDMGAPASAFELFQKWRKSDSYVHFNRGPYFVVAGSAAAAKTDLLAFAGLLERGIE